MISLLVPWRASEPIRTENWNWIRRRWENNYPEAEIVIGNDEGMPFSKTSAVNDAYSRSSGDILVVADADSWVEPHHLNKAIRYAGARDSLVMPWWRAFRLTEGDSRILLESEPTRMVTNQMKLNMVDPNPSPSTAAMVYVISRKAFEMVGGMDPRFRGWGSEDVCFALACGTMLGTKYLLGEVYSLWHPRPRESGARVWEQDIPRNNRALARRYRSCINKPLRMAELCSEHPLEGAGSSVEPSSAPGGGIPLVREFIGPGVI